MNDEKSFDKNKCLQWILLEILLSSQTDDEEGVYENTKFVENKFDFLFLEQNLSTFENSLLST